MFFKGYFFRSAAVILLSLVLILVAGFLVYLFWFQVEPEPPRRSRPVSAPLSLCLKAENGEGGMEIDYGSQNY
ncbi:MAG TPA: hypothetical protein PKO38_09020 [Bacillota bacterium]|jgi:flagellar basal body-associated protein FliL|nr:hypothetical protein [Bacillota bacterium]HOB87814.1 hypothetical protein [Bacillota bacterium]HOP68979.1 hypothetical protein [Bacillota bacterium]HPT34864.1 hypothetical protein [Bacillota bacterium]HPZ64148.1 hypothetical protein [Bacillota bacterium]